MTYFLLIKSVVDFLIVGVSIFLVIKAMNKMKRKKAVEPVVEAPPEPTKEEALLTEIRDLLKEK